MVFFVIWVPKHLLSPKKLGFLAHKQPNLAKNSFLPNIGIFSPFCLMTNQKTMQTRCLGVFFVTWVQRLLLPPVRIRIFGQIGPRFAFFVILGHILACLPISSHARSKNNANKVPRWVFCYVSIKTFTFSSNN